MVGLEPLRKAVLWSIDQRIPVNHPSNVFVSRSIMGPMSGMPRNTDVPYPRVPHAGNVCISQNEQFSYTVLKSLCLTWPPTTQAESFIVHYFASILQVKGSKDESPSALLIAAAQSRSLRSLILLESFIDAAHIKVMASALTIPSLPAEFEALTVRPPPMSRLRKLSLSSCKPFHSDMEAAYAKLIGGKYIILATVVL